MADEAPITGARRRAPRAAAPNVPARDAIQAMVERARILSAAAEQVDAVVLGVETMLEAQRQVMRDGCAAQYWHDGELWHGVAVLLTLARSHAADIMRAGEAIDVEGLRAATPAAA